MTPEQEQALYQAERHATQARAILQLHKVRNQDAWGALQAACHALARQIEEWEKVK